MTDIPILPVWSFEPNWKDSVLETFEWLTDVMRSPTGAEQRRSLRAYPRRTLEYQMVAKGRDRAYFDSYLMKHGGGDWYLPTWQDVHYLEEPLPPAVSFLPCETAAGSIAAGDIVVLLGTTYELLRVSAVTPGGIVTATPTVNAWAVDSRIMVARRARLTDQPRVRRESDDTITVQIRFRYSERNTIIAADPMGDATYGGYRVLDREPDEAESLDYSYERLLEELDNQVGIPSRYDSANLAFPNQRYSWTLNGRAEHASFYNLIYALRGKALPLWLPTFFSDFELSEDIEAGDTALQVWATGFTALGGPQEQRRHIVLELSDGTRLFREITASALAGPGRESIGLDSPLPSALSMIEVLRISFLRLGRLDQDTIEVSHKTDIEGVSTVVATFRATPDRRQVEVGF